MNLSKLIKLTGISLLSLNHFSANAADSDLFKSTMDFTFEPSLYEEAKKVADEIVSSLHIDNFSLSLVESKSYSGNEYHLITNCGSENIHNNEIKLIEYSTFSKTVKIAANSVQSNEDLKSELEKAIYSFSGIEPGTRQLNATMQSACYVSRKLGEMKKYNRNFTIKIKSSVLDNNKKIKVQESNGTAYTLLEISAEGLIQFINFDDNTVKVVNKFQRLNENKKAVYVSGDGKKIGFDEYRQGLFYHMIGLLECKFNMKFAGQKNINNSTNDVRANFSAEEEVKQNIEEPAQNTEIKNEVTEPEIRPEIKPEPSRDYSIAIRSFFSGFFSSSDAT